MLTKTMEYTHTHTHTHAKINKIKTVQKKDSNISAPVRIKRGGGMALLGLRVPSLHQVFRDTDCLSHRSYGPSRVFF